MKDLAELDAVGFKPVCAKGYTGCQYLEDDVLDGMAKHSEYICPMHNEACINAVQEFPASAARTRR